MIMAHNDAYKLKMSKCRQETRADGKDTMAMKGKKKIGTSAQADAALLQVKSAPTFVKNVMETGVSLSNY